MTRLAGEWKIVNGGSGPVGTEKWNLNETTTLSYDSTIDRRTPFPHKENLHVRAVPRTWEIQRIEINSTPDVLVGHVLERFEGSRKDRRFDMETTRGFDSKQASVEVSESTEFDYLSPIFNTITFHRLRLRRGETREIRPFYIFPVSESMSFRTKIVGQRYERLDDEPLSIAAGNFPQAKRYVYTNLETGWTGNIWTDNLETVLRYEKYCELLSYSHTG